MLLLIRFEHIDILIYWLFASDTKIVHGSLKLFF